MPGRQYPPGLEGEPRGGETTPGLRWSRACVATPGRGSVLLRTLGGGRPQGPMMGRGGKAGGETGFSPGGMSRKERKPSGQLGTHGTGEGGAPFSGGQSNCLASWSSAGGVCLGEQRFQNSSVSLARVGLRAGVTTVESFQHRPRLQAHAAVCSPSLGVVTSVSGKAENAQLRKQMCGDLHL